MHSRLTAALVVATLAVAATGVGVALGASTSSVAKACVSTSSHRLALLEHGRCAAGYSKVTLGARGPRGKIGPAGPGATYQQESVGNDDVEHMLSHIEGGIAVGSTCGQTKTISIKLEPASGSGTIEIYGTRSQDTVLNVVSLAGVTSFSATGNTDAAWDVIARAGSGAFVELHIAGTRTSTSCTVTEVAVPTKPAT